LPITIEHLENFIAEIKRTIPLSSVWIKKGKFNLSLSTFAKENPRKEFVEGDFPPFLTEPTRTFFIMVGMPFSITNVRSHLGDFGPQLWYDLQVDTTSTAYKNAVSQTDIAPKYTLSLPGSDRRVKQLHEVLNDYVTDKKKVKLIKDGKAFDFADV
jgi:hypothetical protein